jgi:hypothetical protein
MDVGLSAQFERNAPYTAPGSHVYNTPLSDIEELLFRKWLKDHNVPFNPDASVTDYDMRGFWRGLQSGDPHAQTGQNANDGQLHYSDWWKTPGHQTFSAESQYAGPVAPQWDDQDRLISPGGRVLHDERAPSAADSGIDALLRSIIGR